MVIHFNLKETFKWFNLNLGHEGNDIFNVACVCIICSHVGLKEQSKKTNMDFDRTKLMAVETSTEHS